jgi:serine/threonine protein kinase
MAVAAELPRQVQFAEFVLDLRTGELWRNGDRLPLGHQSFQILTALLEKRGELVTREELVRRLWASDVFVEFEGSLNKAMKRLREVLGDSADTPRFVETLPRHGYRFISSVTVVSGAPSHESLIGKKVSHYRVLEVIGGGGMGLVYKAEDLKLGRRVAVKFLPEELAGDSVALQRFEREARTASSLNHPNICTIHEVEEYEGQPFIVMELLQGETLRDRLASLGSKSVPFNQLLDIALQICDGLQAAHEKGIIHRDIKPANIFLTSGGPVKILDFGLAKLVSAEQPGGDHPEPEYRSGAATQPAKDLRADATLTHQGMAMGTAGYMSPEQVRGEKLDARTDLFSFGLVLYEMATGQRAFRGETAAVIQDAILHRAPLPIYDLNSLVPPKLERVISKAVEKNREQRYQSAAEMLAELKSVSPLPGEAQLVAPKPRRTQARAWIAAIGTFAVLVAAVLLYRQARNKVKLTNQDTIVLADFTNRTSDPGFDEALTTALRMGLEQSPFLNILSPDKVRLALPQIGRSEDAKLTVDLAHKVCLQTHSKVVIAGSIADVGNRYQLGLESLECQSGKPVATAEMSAASRNEIVRTLGAAAAELRRKLSEPTESIQKFNQPLDVATSSSLEALQAYSKGVKQANEHLDAAIPYFKRAVELDPNYAVAYGWLGAAYEGHGYRPAEDTLMKAALTKAYELRERLTQRVRFVVEHVYYRDVTGELEKAVREDEEMIQLFPLDPYGHIGLSAVLGSLGQNERGAAETRESIRLSPDISGYGNLMDYDILLDLPDEAKRTYEEAQSHNFDDIVLRTSRYQLAFLQNDEASMQEQLNWAAGRPEEDQTLWLKAQTEGFHGHLRTEHAVVARAAALANRGGAPSSGADYEAFQSLMDAEVGAKRYADDEAMAALGKTEDPNIRLVIAMASARAGNITSAQKLAEALNRELPLSTTMQNYNLPTIYAAMALARNNPGEAIALLQRSAPYDFAETSSFDSLYPAYIRGLAYLQAGQGQRAATEFQKLLDHRGIVKNWITGALAHLQLGRAQLMLGDTAAARKSYQEFLALWKNADPDIPIYREARAEYAKLQ